MLFMSKAPAAAPAFERAERTLLGAFPGWPKLTAPKEKLPKRIFQLRTYESPSDGDHVRKVEMFHKGEFEIFQKAGCHPVFFADALIPVPFFAMPSPNPAPTIDLTVHFRGGLPPLAERDPEELCLARVRGGLIREGFFEEDTVMWAPDGRVLAHSRQLALLLPMPIG